MSTLEVKSENHPTRMKYRYKPGKNQAQILYHYIFHTLPRVNKLLTYWKSQAAQCSDAELRVQALNSINGKDFHCQGGAVFAVPHAKEEELLI
jgi:tetraprenyl-beta-curcumene synthase